MDSLFHELAEEPLPNISGHCQIILRRRRKASELGSVMMYPQSPVYESRPSARHETTGVLDTPCSGKRLNPQTRLSFGRNNQTTSKGPSAKITRFFPGDFKNTLSKDTTKKRFETAYCSSQVLKYQVRVRCFPRRRFPLQLLVQFTLAHAVASKWSCGRTVVEFQQASQPFTGANLARGLSDPIGGRREQNHVALALMVPFGVKMRNVLAERVPQGPFAE
jgi:hypothetical protein